MDGKRPTWTCLPITVATASSLGPGTKEKSSKFQPASFPACHPLDSALLEAWSCWLADSTQFPLGSNPPETGLPKPSRLLGPHPPPPGPHPTPVVITV